MRGWAVLEHQHRQVETRFVALDAARVDAPALVLDLATHLMAHMLVEQEAFYPFARSARRDAVRANSEEHALLAFALMRLMTADIRHETFAEKVTAVRELFDSHAQEEERDLFAIMTSSLGNLDSEALERKMEQRFEELLALGYDGCRVVWNEAERLQMSAPGLQSTARTSAKGGGSGLSGCGRS